MNRLLFFTFPDYKMGIIGARKPYTNTEEVFPRMPTTSDKIKIAVAAIRSGNWEMSKVWLEVDFIELLLRALEFLDTLH